MTKQGTYYYIIAGLPELVFDGEPPLSVENFVDTYGEALETERELLDLLLLRNDVKNSLLVFQGVRPPEVRPSGVQSGGVRPSGVRPTRVASAGEPPVETGHTIEYPSVYTFDELRENIESGELLPSFFLDFLSQYESDEEYLIHYTELEKAYFHHGSQSDNEFLSRYFSFELDFRNAIAALRARSLEIDVLTDTSPGREDLVLMKIRENKSSPDFGIGGDASWMNALVRAFEEDNPKEREKSIDRVRFDFVGNLTELRDFQIEVVLAYLIRLMILRRWSEFDAEIGASFIQNILQT